MIGCKNGSFGSMHWSHTGVRLLGTVMEGCMHSRRLRKCLPRPARLMLRVRRVIASRPTQLHSSVCYKDNKQCQRYCDQGWRRYHQSIVSILNASVTAGYLDIIN